MTSHVFEAWLLLLYLDYLMRYRGFRRVRGAVQRQTVRQSDEPLRDDAMLSRAMDMACVFYFKRVLCLQRSAALVLLLRRYGRNAQLVIGTQLCPLQSHAWVEIGTRVINDKPHVQQIFQVLDRC